MRDEGDGEIRIISHARFHGFHRRHDLVRSSNTSIIFGENDDGEINGENDTVGHYYGSVDYLISIIR